jgi:hypothetical protein
MPNSKSEDAQIVSVRLPRELIQRLDRYLDRIRISFFRLSVPPSCRELDECRCL